MKDHFQTCLDLVLESEAGFVIDNGGPTNLGVTQKMWESYLGRQTTIQEIKNLTPLMVRPFYYQLYWEPTKCDELPAGLDYCVFDCAVNSGVGRSIRLLQRAVGADPDGRIGSITLALVRKCDPIKTIEQYCDERQRFLESLSTFPTYGKGWTKRVKNVCEQAKRMNKDG